MDPLSRDKRRLYKFHGLFSLILAVVLRYLKPINSDVRMRLIVKPECETKVYSLVLTCFILPSYCSFEAVDYFLQIRTARLS